MSNSIYKVNYFEVNDIGSPEFVRAIYVNAGSINDVAQWVARNHTGKVLTNVYCDSGKGVVSGPDATYSIRKIKIVELP